MRKLIVTACLLLVAPLAAGQSAEHQFPAEVYAFFGHRSSTPGTSVAGAGGEVFPYKGIAAGAEATTTIGNPDDKITIASVGAAYHFACCRASRKVEPFAGGGWSFLYGNINTHGINYPFSSGQDRTGPHFNQGLIVWPLKHLGVRFEVREYRFFVSYGALENVIPGGHFVEVRIGPALR